MRVHTRQQCGRILRLRVYRPMRRGLAGGAVSAAVGEPPYRPHQSRDFATSGDGFGGVAAILKGILIALRSPGGRSAVHPAAAVRHRR
jgi:hypothetical protein